MSSDDDVVFGRFDGSQDQRVRELEKALQQIMQVLGPNAPTHEGSCEGCTYEIGEALRLCRAVGIEYRWGQFPPRRKAPTSG